MSVIVRGMEMPKNCGCCLLAVLRFEGYYCAAQDEREKYDFDQVESRPKDCPLFELKDWREA